MSNRDNFASGFIAGAFVGGAVGAILGVVLTRRASDAALEESSTNANLPESKATKRKKRELPTDSIETARRSLEDKIAQLNEAIDDVRMQLNTVNGSATENDIQRAIAEDL